MIQRPTRAWKLWTLTAVLAAVIALAAVDSTSAAVGPNEVGVPASSSIGVGGDTTINVEGQAPAGDSLAVWAVRVTFDPTVVSFVNCTPMPSPAGYTSASECSLDDPPDDDTVGIVGGAVRNTDGQGLFGSQVLASIQFHAVGALDQCGNLTVVLSAFVNETGDTLTPTVISGQICVAAGTPQKWANVDCGLAGVGIEDAQRIARFLANRTAPTPAGCYNIDQSVTVNGTARLWANVDCGLAGVGIEDAQRIARFLANRTAPTPAGCHDIGASVLVVP